MLCGWHLKNRRIEKPWGYELIWAHTDNYVGKLLHITSGKRLSRQYHEQKEETIYVLKGTLYNYDAEGNISRIMPGHSFHVYPGQIHRFAAMEGNVEVIEVSTNHLDDVVRLEDDYRRE